MRRVFSQNQFPHFRCLIVPSSPHFAVAQTPPSFATVPAPGFRSQSTAMSSPATEGVAMDAPVEVADGEELAAAVVGVEADGDEAKRPEGQLVCCICMETWTCSGAHRICCVPCGHVYGISCLEKWLHHCDIPNAKCPQCGEPFAFDKIMNLYAPGNVWDGCCRMKELEAQLVELRAENKSAAAKLEAMETAFINVLDGLEEFVLMMKERMKKLVEQNATPMDLIRFVKQCCVKLAECISKSASSRPCMMDD